MQFPSFYSLFLQGDIPPALNKGGTDNKGLCDSFMGGLALYPD